MVVIASSALMLPFTASVLGVILIISAFVVGVVGYRSSNSWLRVSALAWCGAICGALAALLVVLFLDGIGLVASLTLTDVGVAMLAGMAMGAAGFAVWARRLPTG